MDCFICRHKSKHVSTETYNGNQIKVYRCCSCNTVFNLDMNNTVSPDYVDIEIDDFHIWLQSYHKSDAFQQFYEKSKSLGDLRDFALIDYGCGTAGFIKLIEENHLETNFGSVLGIDASAKQIEFGKKIVNSPLICSSGIPIDEINKLPEKKIIITMWDVLEHIRRPLDFLNTLKNIDKEVYLFFSVPAANSWFYKFKILKIFNIKHTFIPWEHVTYFTPKSVKLTMEKLNYKLIDIYPVVCYKRKSSIKEALRRLIFKITSHNINIHPQLGVLVRNK